MKSTCRRRVLTVRLTSRHCTQPIESTCYPSRPVDGHNGTWFDPRRCRGHEFGLSQVLQVRSVYRNLENRVISSQGHRIVGNWSDIHHAFTDTLYSAHHWLDDAGVRAGPH